MSDRKDLLRSIDSSPTPPTHLLPRHRSLTNLTPRTIPSSQQPSIIQRFYPSRVRYRYRSVGAEVWAGDVG